MGVGVVPLDVSGVVFGLVGVAMKLALPYCLKDVSAKIFYQL